MEIRKWKIEVMEIVRKEELFHTNFYVIVQVKIVRAAEK